MACATPPEDPDSVSPDSSPESWADTRRVDESAQEHDAAPHPQDNSAETTSEIRPETASFRLFRSDPGLKPGLYVVSTPIGNLRDVTLRALDILSSVDFICAEDTRVAGKLLAAFGVSARVRPYHDHNGAQARPAILAELEGGARVALMSDAGTPLVSDPGFKLVREAAHRGIELFAIPGASAPMAALAVAGLPTDRFMFAGFPPPRHAARVTFFEELKPAQTTLIFFEGPSRLAASIADMAAVFGPREAAVARELTKKFEQVRRGSLGDLAAAYAQEDAPRGELVVLVGPPSGPVAQDAGGLDAAILAADPGRKLKDVAAEIAARFGLKRRDVYERALALRAEPGDAEGDGDAGETPARRN